MAPGETRPLYIQVLGIFPAIFPNVNINDLVFTGGYIGTEQFKRAEWA